MNLIGVNDFLLPHNHIESPYSDQPMIAESPILSLPAICSLRPFRHALTGHHIRTIRTIRKTNSSFRLDVGCIRLRNLLIYLPDTRSRPPVCDLWFDFGVSRWAYVLEIEAKPLP